MYIPHSLLASAVVLSFSTQAGARFTPQDPNHAKRDVAEAHDDSKLEGILQRWPFNKLFANKRQEMEAFVDVQCPTDDLYIEILDAAPSSAVQVLCNNLLDIPPATTITVTTAVG